MDTYTFLLILFVLAERVKSNPPLPRCSDFQSGGVDLRLSPAQTGNKGMPMPYGMPYVLGKSSKLAARVVHSHCIGSCWQQKESAETRRRARKYASRGGG